MEVEENDEEKLEWLKLFGDDPARELDPVAWDPVGRKTWNVQFILC